MSEPEYRAPESLDEALRIKAQYGADARVIAGGTDLILRMRDGVLSPGMLLDLRHLSLDTISVQAGEIRIGAYVTHSQMMASAEVGAMLPALVEACKWFAGPPIRNRGTVAGNIVNASPAADLLPPLIAYDARIVLASSSGHRVLPLTDFFTGPGRTVLPPNEVLQEILVPRPPRLSAATFSKLGQRQSMAISIVNLSTRLTLDPAGRVSGARIVLGSVAPTVIRAAAAEALLIGAELSTERLGQAAQLASGEISPISDVRSSGHYRRRVTEVLVRRALLAAWDELRGMASHG